MTNSALGVVPTTTMSILAEKMALLTSSPLTHSRFRSRRGCRSPLRLFARDEYTCEHQSQAANSVQTHWLVEQQSAIDQRHTGEKIGNDKRARRTNSGNEPVVAQISQ